MYVTLDENNNIIDPITQEIIEVGGIAPNGKLFEFDVLVKNIFIKFTCPLTNMMYETTRIGKIDIKDMTLDQLEFECENFMEGNEQYLVGLPCLDMFKDMIAKKYTSVSEDRDSDVIFKYNTKKVFENKIVIAPTDTIINDCVVCNSTIVNNGRSRLLFNNALIINTTIMGGTLGEIRFTNLVENTEMSLKLINVNFENVGDIPAHFRYCGFRGTLIIEQNYIEKYIYNIYDNSHEVMNDIVHPKVAELIKDSNYSYSSYEVQ